MGESEERNEQDDVEAHRRYQEEPPTEGDLDRRRRAIEDESTDEDPDVEAHRR